MGLLSLICGGSWWFVMFRGGSWCFGMFRGSLWWFMVVCDVSWWFVMVCGGSWWFVMFCGGSWCFGMFRGSLWWFMVVCDVSWWFVMVRGGFSLQFSRKYHVTHYLTNQSPRFSIKSHFEWDFVMVRDVSWWFVVVRDDSWWFVMVRDGSWWFVVVRDDLWWFVMFFSLEKGHVTLFSTNQSPKFTINSHFGWDFVMVRDGLFVMVSWWFVMFRDGFVVVRDGSWWFVMFYSLEKGHVTLFSTNQRPKFTMKSHFWWDFVFAPFHLKSIPLKSSAKNGVKMLKTFWPLKELLHTYTHTHSCIPSKFWWVYRVPFHFLYQMGSNTDN